MGVGPEYPNASYNARRAPQRHHGELGSSNDPRGSRLGCLVVIGSGGILERGLYMLTKVEQGSSHYETTAIFRPRP